ncbi:MAG: phosphorothioated DNA-binding restriction endonuclease [Motilibacteraceae bacterium]
MTTVTGISAYEDAVSRLLALRQHQQDGKRSPHKPLLVLLALGRLSSEGTSELRWSQVRDQLADLLADFGRPSRTAPRQAAAYPFTHLRSDGVWTLSADVEMDKVRPLDTLDPIGRLDPGIEQVLKNRPGAVEQVARAIVDAQFPPSLADDVLEAVGLAEIAPAGQVTELIRRRSTAWRLEVLDRWDRSCAFCGFDGQLGRGVVAVEAAHVRWFNHGGPNDADNGLALCSLHHKLLDVGALGLSAAGVIKVSGLFVARTEAGRAVYDLHGRELTPRPGTVLPAAEHLAWHDREVSKGEPLTRAS